MSTTANHSHDHPSVSAIHTGYPSGTSAESLAAWATQDPHPADALTPTWRAFDALAQSASDVDPTRTKTLRKRYAQKLRGKYANIVTELRTGIIERDIFGLRSEGLATQPPTFRFETDGRKVEGFRAWLDRQLENDVLHTIGPNGNRFITPAYRRGLYHADTQMRQAGLQPPPQSVQTAINAPVHVDQLQLLYTRNYQALQGINDEVGKQISRELADGLVQGDNPRDIARSLTDRIDAIGKNRATVLARTEIINAHAEATLNRFETADSVEGVAVKAEWQTAGDSRVCPICQALEGNVYTIEQARSATFEYSASDDEPVSLSGSYPVKPPAHPQCRCALLPVGG